MTFDEVLEQAIDMLQRRGRLTYGALRRQFQLDDEYLADLKEELIEGQRVAVDENGKVLIWTGETSEAPPLQTADAPALERPPPAQLAHTERTAPAGERRQLTVMFCDLVGSTALSEQLDPEELQTVVRTYQEVSAQVIERYEGHIAQYLGDGLLVYFGYPVAHEDDAARAVRAGLEIVSALDQAHSQFPQPVSVRIGIHTGPVVVGQMGGGSRHEQLALGETPNIAARVQGKADPNTVVISTDTYHLVQGLFECQDLGASTLKGVTTPLALFRVRTAHSRFEAAVQAGLTPLVGREEELALLRRRWEQATEGEGQVVLLSGEAGIGKSRLIQGLKEHTEAEGAIRIELWCSPYYQNSALYPLIEYLQRVLQFEAGDTPQDKLQKLERTLSRCRFPRTDTLPLLASLLSLPQPEGTPPLALNPQQQKQRTFDTLIAWFFEEAENATVYSVWEDLQWADSSTLELLSLCLDQAPTARMLMLLTFRPEFTPPWASRLHHSQLVLNRLGRKHINEMVAKVTGGKILPAEVLRQVMAKTDGVPLFVEELTKMVMESGLLREANGHYELTGPLPLLAIPSTLQDSLMARLDRLSTAREVAQLGATIGREFSYELLRRVSLVDETTLQQGLRQLADAELVYPHGVLPQASYVFKHALVQETAYQSLLKSKRQQVHRQIAQALEEQFPDMLESQPELVARHYTEAGLGAKAIPYWQRAGERAAQRSANVEANHHLTTGLDLLTGLPDTPERVRQELTFQTTLGPALIAIKGNAAPEVEHVYDRARELCQRLGETPELFPVLFGLRSFYLVKGELSTAHELGEQLLKQAQDEQDRERLVEAHLAVGTTFFFLGDIVASHRHYEQMLGLYDPQLHRSHTLLYGLEPAVVSLCRLAWGLAYLGYPDQAVEKRRELIDLVQETAHPFSSALGFLHAAAVHQARREAPATQQWAEEGIRVCTEHGFRGLLGQGNVFRGWARAWQGHGEAGIAEMRQGLALCQTTGALLFRPFMLSLLAETYGLTGSADEGLGLLREALETVDKTGERLHEAEFQRLNGELLLLAPESKRQRAKSKSREESGVSESLGLESRVPSPQSEAEQCFQRALTRARKQRTKSLELRAATSLARLWQHQGKKEEAHQLLSEIYNWFTEGFDTPDLKDAKALLQELT